jgi:hypothetical protein
METELTDIISEALGELADPVEDTQEVVEDAVEDTEVDDLADVSEEEVEQDEADESVDDSDGEVEDSSDSETYTVKVDGETVEVTLKEALAGYQRQADYTRKMQALAEERKEFEEAGEQIGGVLEQVQALDEAWAEDPVQVLAQFTANTDNPTHAVALLIKELAGAGLLEQQFLEMFGITPDVRNSWAQETRANKEARAQRATQNETMTRAQELEQEQAIQKAVAEYEAQIDDILESEDIDLTVRERKEFRSKLAGYAKDNDITNLKAAYKAMKYEESRQKQTLAKKTAERAKAKKAVSAVNRGSSPAGSPVDGSETDLRSIIMNAMKDQ